MNINAWEWINKNKKLFINKKDIISYIIDLFISFYCFNATKYPLIIVAPIQLFDPYHCAANFRFRMIMIMDK